MNKKEIIVQNERKLHMLLQDFGFSFVDVNKMLRNKDVKVNGKHQKENILLQTGDIVSFYFSDDMLEKKYQTIFESNNVIVIYKSAGIETEGEKGLESVLKAIAVHRLDRNTEGLMIFAKNQSVAKILEQAFKNHKVHKFYVAEVVGKFETDKTYNAFLLKDSENSSVKIFDKKVSNAVPISTKIKTIKAGQESSVVQVELLTGKTHQIRAHLAFLGHSILGDGKYGKNEINKKFKQNRQKLACFCLKFDFLGISELSFKEFKKSPSCFEVDKI